MKPSRHIAASIALGTLFWFITRSISAGAICCLSGIMVDTDHIIEWLMHYGWKGLTYSNIYKESEDTYTNICKEREDTYKNICKESEDTYGPGMGGFKRLYLVFHSAELIILFWILAFVTENIYVFAIALGHSSHVALDYIGNEGHLFAYFWIWRFVHKFNIEKMQRRKKGRA
ncbi:MAG: hypothetical protein ABID09_00790 [Candidatus Omnitrophota bacterium]